MNLPGGWFQLSEYTVKQKGKKKVRFEVRGEGRYKSLVLSFRFWDWLFYIQKSLMSHYIFRSNGGTMNFKTSLFCLIQSWIFQEGQLWRLDSTIKDSTCSDSSVESFLPIWNLFQSYLDVHVDQLVAQWSQWPREQYGWLLDDVSHLPILWTLNVGERYSHPGTG